MPAQADIVRSHIDRFKIGAALDFPRVKRGGPVAEPPVGLLKRHQIGAQTGDDVERPVRLPSAIEADAFADIVGGDP